MSVSEQVTLTNKGKRIFGVMHPPAGSDKAPAVMILHGFGGSKCGKHRVYVSVANALAAQGIGVLRFDFRGAGDSEGDFRDISVEGQVSDAFVALDYLSSLPYVDNTRFGILGSSFGGVVAVLTATKRQDVRSLVLWAPPYQTEEWLTLWKQHQELAGDMPIHEQVIRFQSEPATASFVHEFLTLPLHNVIPRLHHIPLLHFHGEQDTVVDPKHAEHYEAYRQGANAPTRFVRLKNCSHDFSDPTDQQQLITESCNWFARTLKQ